MLPLVGNNPDPNAVIAASRSQKSERIKTEFRAIPVIPSARQLYQLSGKVIMTSLHRGLGGTVGEV